MTKKEKSKEWTLIWITEDYNLSFERLENIEEVIKRSGELFEKNKKLSESQVMVVWKEWVFIPVFHKEENKFVLFRVEG